MTKGKVKFKKIAIRTSKHNKNKQYDKKIFRLMYILNKLDTGASVSVRELAAEFNVTTRSVQRDLSLLERANFRVKGDGMGKYTFEEGFSLKKLMLSDEQASLLAFLCEISQSMGEKFVKSFNSIWEKILAKDVSNPYFVKVPDGVKLREDYPFIIDLEMAINSCCKAVVAYQPLNSETVKSHKVKPLKMILVEGFWYLLCQRDGVEEPMKLRMERIKTVQVLEQEDFFPPDNLKEMLGQCVNIWFTGKRNKIVTLKVDKEVARYFKERIYFPCQRISKTETDGSLLLRTKVSDFMEIVYVIYNWLPFITVIEPQELKDKIKESLSSYLRQM